MSRLTTRSTIIGLVGLVLAMLTALGGASAVVLGLSFSMMVLGMLGALVGAAATLARAG